MNTEFVKLLADFASENWNEFIEWIDNSGDSYDAAELDAELDAVYGDLD